MENKNIVSIEERIPKLKEERRKKANRRLIFYLSIFFTLIGLIIYLQSPLSHIKTIQVTGNDLVKEEDIIIQSELTYETNLWSIKIKDVEQLLEQHPIIQEAKITRKFPSTVKVSITEYKHVGFVENEREYYLLLANGELVQEDIDDISGAPIIVGFQEEMFELLAEQLAMLPDSILQLISEIHLQSQKELERKIFLYMNDGFTVNASLRNFAEQMKAYPSIISQLDDDVLGTIYLGLDAYFEPYQTKK